MDLSAAGNDLSAATGEDEDMPQQDEEVINFFMIDIKIRISIFNRSDPWYETSLTTTNREIKPNYI